MVNSLPTAAFYLCFGSSSVSQFYKIQSKFAITKKKAWVISSDHFYMTAFELNLMLHITDTLGE